MSKRDRFGDAAPYIMLAIGLILNGLFSYSYFDSKGYQRANQEHQSEDAANATTKDNQDKCRARATIDEALECFSSNERASRENQTAKQDLNTQREMADWAEGMLWSTYISLFVTSLGVFYVALTLREARAATAAAIKAADAAVATNETAREIGQAQVRAYLTVSVKATSVAAELWSGIIPERVEKARRIAVVDLEFSLLNSGNSPALYPRIRFAAIGHSGPPPHISAFRGVSSFSISIPSGGKCIIPEQGAFVMKEDERWDNPTFRIFYFAEFIDVFKEKRAEQMFMGVFKFKDGEYKFSASAVAEDRENENENAN